MSKRVIQFSLCIGFFLVHTSVRAADGKLEISFFDVGQADAVLAICPDGTHHLLIDSGDTRYPDSSANFRTNLLQAFQGKPRQFTAVVASHPHTDHIGSMLWVLTNFTVGTYVDNGQKTDAANFGKLEATRRKLVKSGKLTYVNGKQDSFSKIQFCPQVEMEILEAWATHPKLSDTNDRSVAVRLKYKDRTFLFVGDIEAEGETVMLNEFKEDDRKKLDVDVLKVGHHGSDTSSTVAFINAVSPDLVIVSCGKKGVGTNAGYKHPRSSTLRSYGDWFKNHPPSKPAATNSVWSYDAKLKKWRQETRPNGARITALDGTVIVRTDGKELEVHQEKP